MAYRMKIKRILAFFRYEATSGLALDNTHVERTTKKGRNRQSVSAFPISDYALFNYFSIVSAAIISPSFQRPYACSLHNAT